LRQLLAAKTPKDKTTQTAKRTNALKVTNTTKKTLETPPQEGEYADNATATDKNEPLS
jgi:hypothetical protein